MYKKLLWECVPVYRLLGSLNNKQRRQTDVHFTNYRSATLIYSTINQAHFGLDIYCRRVVKLLTIYNNTIQNSFSSSRADS